ncbi:MAG: trigger factor family protein, partial [Ignavibacteria bacterium]
MESKVNVLSDCEHEIDVTLGYDEIQPEIEEAYKKERKSIALPGFRKGKVPMQMIKKLYG